MERSIKTKLESNLKAFSMGQLQDFKTISKVLVNLNIPLPQFIQYVEETIDTVIISRRPKIPRKQCPECLAYMIPFPVNVSPNTQVDKQYNSVWMCMNRECMETIYTPETIQDIVKSVIKTATSNTGGR